MVSHTDALDIYDIHNPVLETLGHDGYFFSKNCFHNQYVIFGGNYIV